MTEIEKIAYAKGFLDALAEGVNPLDGTALPESDIVNNVRISRCLFYVSDVLRQVIENGGTERRSSSREPFRISAEQLANFSFSEMPITVSEIAKRVSALVPEGSTKKMSASAINKWLLKIGALEESQNEYGRSTKLPTEEGQKLGIIMDNRQGPGGNYYVSVYSRKAQEFIIDNFEAILDS